MSDFPAKLKKLRTSRGETQEIFAKFLETPIASYNRYERGEADPPYDFLSKMIEKLGDEARPLMPGWKPLGLALQEESPDYSAIVTAALPEHISEAWSILHEAATAAEADLMRLDVAAVGEMLGAAAEAIAQGRGGEVRARAVRRAEVVLRAMRPTR